MNTDNLAKDAEFATEEPVNTYLNRPLASFFVDFLYKSTNVTPNQITLMAMLIGVAAGVLIGMGTKTGLFLGALVYQLSIVLDCVDGQLARLKKMSSEIGRILDGAGDYVVGIAIAWGSFNAIGNLSTTDIFFSASRMSITGGRILILLSFLSVIIHSIFYDFIKVKFSSIIKTGIDQTVKEKMDLQNKQKTNSKKRSSLQNILYSFYVNYSTLQQRVFSLKKYSKLTYTVTERKAILEEHRKLARMWSWAGPNSHMVIIVLSALFGSVILSAFLCLIPMNIYFIFLIRTTQKELNR